MTTYESLLDRDFEWALLEASRYFEGGNTVHETLRRLASRFDEISVDYAVVGALAKFFHGYRRFTHDVDVIVTAEGLARIEALLIGNGYLRESSRRKRLRDAATGVRIDFLVSGQSPGDGLFGPIAFPVPAEASEFVGGFQVISLDRLIELKLASGQESYRIGDLHDVQRLIQASKLPENFAERLDPSIRDAYLASWKDAQIAAQEE